MLVILFMLTLVIPTYSASTSSNELTELTKEQKKLKDEIEKKTQEITKTQIEIESLNSTMAANKKQITQLNDEIATKQQELNDQMTNFKSTLEVMQRLSNSNGIVTYVTSDNDQNFLLKFKNVMMLSETIETNIQAVTADIATINDALNASKSYQAQNSSNQAKAEELISNQKNTEEQLRTKLNSVDSDVLKVSTKISIEAAAKREQQQQAQVEKAATKAIAAANKKADNKQADKQDEEDEELATNQPTDENKEPATDENKEPEAEVTPVEPEPTNSNYPSDGNVTAYKTQLLGAAGINSSDLKYVDYIISKESGWNYLIANSYSGAYGLCQALPGSKMASSGSDWATNPETQLKWCNTYAVSRYGSWQGAYNFWIDNNWW